MILLSFYMILAFVSGDVDLLAGIMIAISGVVAATIIHPYYVKGILEYDELQPVFRVISIPFITSLIAGVRNSFWVATWSR